MKQTLMRLRAALLALALLGGFAACGEQHPEPTPLMTNPTQTAPAPATIAIPTTTAAPTTAAPATTAAAQQKFFDATQEQLDKLLSLYENLDICGVWRGGFVAEKSSFAKNLQALNLLNSYLFDEIDVNLEDRDYVEYRIFHGIVNYEIGYAIDEARAQRLEEVRHVVDPKAAFAEIKSKNSAAFEIDRYYSIDAETVEWMQTVLFGGEQPDRAAVTVDAATRMACYYYDGRYYFMDGNDGYGGATEVPLLIDKTERGDDGRYNLTIGYADWDLYYDQGIEKVLRPCQLSVALVEWKGDYFWKFFKVEW